MAASAIVRSDGRMFSPTTINLPAELKAEAKRLGIVISTACISGLEAAVAAANAQRKETGDE